MTPDLRDRLEQAAQWHRLLGRTQRSDESKAFHSSIAADIDAAIVSADDATKNMLILRAHKAKDRRFTNEPITGFDELQEQQP